MRILLAVTMFFVVINSVLAAEVIFEGTNTYVGQYENCENLSEDIMSETLKLAQEQAQGKAEQFCNTSARHAIRNTEFEIKSECHYKSIPFGSLTLLTKTASAAFECR